MAQVCPTLDEQAQNNNGAVLFCLFFLNRKNPSHPQCPF